MNAEERADKLARIMADVGLIHEPSAETMAAPVVPEWWAEVEPPQWACEWCQRPAGDVALEGGICPACYAAQASAEPDRVALLGHWGKLTPAARRLHLAARWRVDPWTGRRVVIRAAWVDVDHSGAVGAAEHPLITMVPRTSWDTAPEA
jgi:hypothetical protein